MAGLDGSWFREESDLFDGISFGLEVEKILFKERSKFQEILVFKRLVLNYVKLYFTLHCTLSKIVNLNF